MVALTLRPSRPMLAQLWRRYEHSLQRNPLGTKAVTSGIGFLLGDCIAQSLGSAQGAKPYDPWQSFKATLFGLALIGPINHFWFTALDKVVLPTAPKSPGAVVLKIACDQLLMSPVGTAMFMYHMQAMDGRYTIDPVSFREKIVTSLVAAYKLWPLAHAVNFSVIPARHRVLYINAVAIVWTTILSQIQADTSPKSQTDAANQPQLLQSQQ